MSKQRSFLNLRSGSRGQPPPEPGQVVVEGYRLERLIGSGPLTAAYAAVLESHQQAVVLKILLPHLAESEVFVQRFLQAANAARLVNDDHVLSCYDVGQSNGWVYMTCELVDGDSLQTLVAPLDRSRAVYFAWQVALGLEAVHGAGLVHGNLRPSNVLVDSEDGVRLADLGLPTLPDGDAPASPASLVALHLPPEALTAEIQPNNQGDIYALGVVLIGCILGRTPWSGNSRQRLIELHEAGVPVLGEIPPAALDPDLAAVLARATASRPEERYAEIWQLREDLERLQHQFAPIHARSLETAGAGSALRDPGVRSTRSVQEAFLQPAVPDRRPLWTGIAIGVTAVAVLAVVAGLAFADGGREPAKRPTLPAVVLPPPAAAEPAAAKPHWATKAGKDTIGRWAELACAGSTQRFRLIPAGSFWMGSASDQPGRAADEDRHLVTLNRAFWLGDTEVTQALFTAVAGTSPAHFPGGDRPVETISWNAVQDFLARLGGQTGAPLRLPSEAEWEFACLGGSENQAAPGPDRAWTAESNLDGTRPVARLKANSYGLFDMQGNVLEWVEDTYGRYHRESSNDPLATGGVHRVIRGGAWNLDPADARPAARSKALPVAAFFYLGFRLAVSDG